MFVGLPSNSRHSSICNQQQLYSCSTCLGEWALSREYKISPTLMMVCSSSRTSISTSKYLRRRYTWMTTRLRSAADFFSLAKQHWMRWVHLGVTWQNVGKFSNNVGYMALQVKQWFTCHHLISVKPQSWQGFVRSRAGTWQTPFNVSSSSSCRSPFLEPCSIVMPLATCSVFNSFIFRSFRGRSSPAFLPKLPEVAKHCSCSSGLQGCKRLWAWSLKRVSLQPHVPHL